MVRNQTPKELQYRKKVKALRVENLCPDLSMIAKVVLLIKDKNMTNLSRSS